MTKGRRTGVLGGALCLTLASSAPAQLPIVRPLSVRVPVTHRDTLGLRRQTGSLIVVVRDVETPSRPVAQAQVFLLKSRADKVVPGSAIHLVDELGIVRLDSVPQGAPLIGIRRLGYRALRVPIEIIAGCTSEVEVYMAGFRCDIGPCEDPVPRTTLTVCGKPDA